MRIDYTNIALAVNYYERLGYKYMEVPWIVSKEAMNVTKPPFATRTFETFMGDLVASGEQSFIELMIYDCLPKGKYVCVTPCFRDEVVDPLHQNWFMKVELIRTDSTQRKDLVDLMYDAVNFYVDTYEMYTKGQQHPTIDDPASVYPYSYDILSPDGIELGSYGIRSHGDHEWVYGTGVAEPRLSYALALREKNLKISVDKNDVDC
jgi:hypothetical protein